MYLKRNHLLNNDLQTHFIKNINEEVMDDSTFTLWKSELEKEISMFWQAMDEQIKPRRRFSHSS